MATAPDGSPGLVAQTLVPALNWLTRLREQVERLRKDYREREDLLGLQTIVTALLLTLEAAERHVVTQVRRWDRDDPSDEEQLGRRIGVLLGSLEDLLLPKLLEKARTLHGHDFDVLVMPITRMAKELDPSSETILWPSDTYHVDIDQLGPLLEWASQVDERLYQALRALPSLTIISYPAHSEGDVLTQAVLAHEVAHVSYNKPRDEHARGTGEEVIAEALARHAEAYERLVRERTGVDPRTSDVVEPLLSSQERRRLKSWFRELACDRIAIRLIGPAFVFALFDVEGPRSRWSQSDREGAGFQTHPGLSHRLRLAIAQAKAWLPANRSEHVWQVAEHELTSLEQLLPPDRDALDPLEQQILDEALEALDDESMLGVADYPPGVFRHDLPLVWEKLRSGIPPAEKISHRVQHGGEVDVARALHADRWSQPIDWRSVLAGCYLKWLSRRPTPDELDDPASRGGRDVAEWHRFNEFVRGSIELSEMLSVLGDARASLDQLNEPPQPRRWPLQGAAAGGMLGRDEIVRRLLSPDSRLAMTPIVDHQQQLGEASIDLRLGPDLIVTRQATGLSTFDPARIDEIHQRLHEYQDYVRRPVGTSFFLHPGEFALARTLEFVTLPGWTAGQVNGRSSWGRLGLMIATAGHIEPGFQGTVTLELANLGTVPIVLYVGIRIAQITLFDVCAPPDEVAHA